MASGEGEAEPAGEAVAKDEAAAAAAAAIATAATAAKDAANQLFKDKHYALAVDGYSRAILLDPKSAIFLSNRAAAHIKLESYGAAIADASTALELDPKYIKAYYRRGDANFAMGKFKLALKDLRAAARVAPSDRSLRQKLLECEKEVKRLRFEEALAVPDAEAVCVSDTLDLATVPVEDSYTGPHMARGAPPAAAAAAAGAAAADGAAAAASQAVAEDRYVVTLEFVAAMLEEFKAQRLIHRRYALEVILQAQAALKAQASLVDVEVPVGSHFTVCGDVHGQFYDLMHIFELNGQPSPENPYLFNGDFVDRGSFSVEVMLTLLAFKALYPDHMHLTRGNHESRSMNKLYGFDGEVRAKYNGTVLEVFRETFNWLPLALVLNRTVMITHGGLFSRDGVTLDDLRAISRNREPPDEGLMCELLWSDPHPLPGLTPSKRGVGVQFGPDITKRFLEENGLSLLVRSHEVKEEGYEVAHDGQCVTIFSAPNYCDQMGNKGAFVRFDGADMVPHFTTFDASPHPNVKPMAYASQFLSGGM